MTIYVDISELYRTRANTGIQRVLKEFLQRVVSKDQNITYKVVSFNSKVKSMELLNNDEIKQFLNDTKNFEFKNKQIIDITNIKAAGTTIFFDMDSQWNSPLKRTYLYPILKENGFLIFNFLYDLVPIVLPHFSHNNTVRNFTTFLSAIYKYSDMVFFDSSSAQNDFTKVKEFLDVTRNIPTRVIGLGSNFFKNDFNINTSHINKILKKKYILFVGTIEPRKSQENMLDAFEVLAKKYPDLNLVFIGRQGWKVDNLIKRITTHKLIDKQLYWLNDIDDNTLNQFYQNAFAVTYLSKYEGYGLPIAESLQLGNVTITSKNSSMYEVGRDFADYVVYNSQNELVDIISLYCDNETLYENKKEYIRNNFKATSWDMMYTSMINIFNNFEKSITLKQNHLKTLQFVFISIDIDNLEGTIKEIDKNMDFVKEYIIVTQSKLIEKFENISTNKKVIVIDESKILKEYSVDFKSRDHQSKNWLLRASLLNLDLLDEEFIMLDDDNRPLKKIDLEFFISKDGRYNAYYFYNLLEWNHKNSDYDLGQQNLKKILSKDNYELLSYSSHAPQIINKTIFKEVIDKFFDIGLDSAIDEWSTYFNYANSIYPYLFNKKVFETLNWPARSIDWDHVYPQNSYSFENYYDELYKDETFNTSNTYEEKIQIKEKELAPYLKSKEMFEENIKILSSNNLVHGVLPFKNEDLEFYISNIPYYFTVEKDSSIRLKLNYKLLNLKLLDLELELLVLLNGNPRLNVKLDAINNSKYQESIIEVPIVTTGLEEGVYDITFDLKVNNNNLYLNTSPYLTKLIVSDNQDLWTCLQNPQIVTEKIIEEVITTTSLKDKLKTIPLIGWLGRFSYNLLRLNNLKHTVFMQQDQIKSQKEQLQSLQDYMHSMQNQINSQSSIINTQQNQIINQVKQNVAVQKQINLLQNQMTSYKNAITDQQNHNKAIQTQISNHKNVINSTVSKEIFYQSLSMQQRIDQFVFDAKMTLKDSSNNLEQKLDVIEQDNKHFMDNYYLEFENKFRGTRDAILKRYESYLTYINIEDISKSLDIGCGRAEWVELLQNNGIDASGLDMNHAMIEEGKKNNVKNLEVIDAFEYLRVTEDNSFDLITGFHIIEHIPFEKLLMLIKEVKRVLKPNGQVMFETPNPENLLVASLTFYKDPTHLNPLPPEVIEFMVDYLGFSNAKVVPINPFPTSMHLREDSQSSNTLNRLLFKEQDYIVIANK